MVVKINKSDMERFQHFVARFGERSPAEARYLLDVAGAVLGRPIVVLWDETPPPLPEQAQATESHTYAALQGEETGVSVPDPRLLQPLREEDLREQIERARSRKK